MGKKKSVPAARRQAHRARRGQRGAALLIFMLVVVVGALTYLVSALTPVFTAAGRARQTQEALNQARDALLGYALRYRDDQITQGQTDLVYGYLPLPDLGSSRNNNADPKCWDAGGNPLEGCDAAIFAGNVLNTTVIGRLPWRTLGIAPPRDADGECLWYAVSGSHQRIQRTSPMNWDTPGHLDVVVANGGAALASVLASGHDRPVAVIFSPGPPLPGQNRAPSANGDDVTTCGGNYDVANYLDPANAAALGGVTNYLAGTNKASSITNVNAPKALSTQGRVFASGANFLADACPAGDCDLVANDLGLAVTGDVLFGAIRKNANFRTDINSMLDRMTFCLRDQVVAGSAVTPAAITGYAPPADKSAGRIPPSSCYDDNQPPKGYYSHYQEMLFLAKPNSGNFTVNGDPNCAAVLLFAEQRSGSQQRFTTAQKDTLSNYLEGTNLASLTATGVGFSGATLFDRLPPQPTEKDIARCIPASAGFTPVTSPTLAAQGFAQLVAYDAATRTLTLGAQDVTTGAGAGSDALFGCAWVSDARTLGSGLRTYFRFQFKKVGTSVGGNGFVFALADALRNSFLSCGASGSHLAYSGDNGTTPKITFPKIGLEFDQGRNTGFSETSNPGRNDPCGASGCGGSVGYNSHAAIVYWGHETDNATDAVTLEDNDDNAHGFPTAGSLPGALRPPPRSDSDPATEPGIKFVNLRGYPDNDYDAKLYHVRLELTPTRNANAGAAELSNTAVRTEVWIEPDVGGAADKIAAMQDTTRPMSLLYANYNAARTLDDTAILYDVQEAACSGGACPSGQVCGTDNFCYRPALQTIQLGFTGSQRTSDQLVIINSFFTTWLP